ncbi:Glutathione-regulated potassium-efflux system ancillary protein kefF [Leminorella richardii]|uniref:Glutathione-regulated potassium-efflux system ancillary protein kefF n=1 Tax=Leminorella richardii TaxID=158841 RepID=A0A2X4X8R6_9GAMM|nr:NAD(P)H oxidoreductase [Leminorella richardii]SQI36075.1 Glutathione-regulated potassium-efflux system ancillary protein kefF [Leminorella richardii]
MENSAKGHMYIIWAHPRHDSLTAKIVSEIRDEAEKRGQSVSELDLHRSGFNPVLEQDDEPDWNDPKKAYTDEVHRLFNDVQQADSIVVVFPVWWYSFPAILKGYFDRVWNYGLAYGTGHRVNAKNIRWVPLVGGSEEKFVVQGREKNLSDFVNGMAFYAHIDHSDVEYIYNTIGVEEDIMETAEHYQNMFNAARRMVGELVSA